jgi:peroxiredoxin
VKAWWVLALAVAGCAPSRPQLDPQSAVPDRAKLESLNLKPQSDHFVVPGSWVDRKGEPVAGFTLPDVDGRPYTLSSDTKPVLLFFVERECPCCVGAKPFLERVRSKYKDVLDTVAVIDADVPRAKKWSDSVTALFPVLSDPEQKVVKQYRAERGAYTVLVHQGKIIRAYPGYSGAMLTDLGRAVAESAKVPVRPIDTSGAPEKMVTGCTFPDPTKP